MSRITYEETIRRIVATFPMHSMFTSHTVREAWLDRPAGKRTHTSHIPNPVEIGCMIPKNMAVRVGRVPAGPIIWRRIA